MTNLNVLIPNDGYGVGVTIMVGVCLCVVVFLVKSAITWGKPTKK